MVESERRRRRQRHSSGSPAGQSPGPSDEPVALPPTPVSGTARSAGTASTGGTTPSAATGASARTGQGHDVAERSPAPPGRRRPESGGPPAEEQGERGLRGLVGSGSSQVSVGAALRARDAARPTEADLAEAERRLVVIRRNWTPREELPRPDSR